MKPDFRTLFETFGITAGWQQREMLTKITALNNLIMEKAKSNG